MDKAKAIADIEAELPALRWSGSDLCKAAGITRQSWWRLQKDPEQLSVRTLHKLEVAVRDRRAELSPA